MVEFSNIILRAISSYKLILRKEMSAPLCSVKIRQLGLKRQYVRNLDNAGLYHLGLKIIRELKGQLADDKVKKTVRSYKGAAEFLQYLEEVYSKYKLEGKKIVHVGQKSSDALLTVIQMVSLARGELTEDMMQEIKKYGNIIAEYGDEKQKHVFFDIIASNSGQFFTDDNPQLMPICN